LSPPQYICVFDTNVDTSTPFCVPPRGVILASCVDTLSSLFIFRLTTCVPPPLPLSLLLSTGQSVPVISSSSFTTLASSSFVNCKFPPFAVFFFFELSLPSHIHMSTMTPGKSWLSLLVFVACHFYRVKDCSDD